MLKTLKLLSIAAVTLAFFSMPADAGERRSGTGFFLFDIFGAAPNSIYREQSPKVRGFRRKVGGYSYRYSDVANNYSPEPRDFSPIFDSDVFSGRLGIDGPYIGD